MIGVPYYVGDAICNKIELYIRSCTTLQDTKFRVSNIKTTVCYQVLDRFQTLPFFQHSI